MASSASSGKSARLARQARGLAGAGDYKEGIRLYQESIREGLGSIGDALCCPVDRSLELHEMAYGIQLGTLDDEMVTLKKRLYELHVSKESRALKSRCLAYGDIADALLMFSA